MNNRALLSVASLSLIVAACAAIDGFPRPGGGTPGTKSNPCNAVVCEITITVTQCTQQNNDIKADPDPEYVVAPPNTGIHWTIASSGFVFNGQGIDFKTDNGKKTFHHPRPGSTDWSTQNAGTAGKYDYWIRLKGPNGTCDRDPSIMN